MSHNINYSIANGKHSFFSVKEKAWHGLGTIIDKYPTSAEALQYAGLDYTVEKRNLFTYDTFNQDHAMELPNAVAGISVPGFYATVRNDTEQVLGVVGNDYQVVQNVDAFSFFDAIVGGGEGVLYETAGALGKGERIFITAKLPDYIRVGKDDCIEKYLFLTTSHDGYGSITAAFTPVRVVCNNTLNAALRENTNCIKIRHTASAQQRLQQAHRLMGISNLVANELEEVFNHWSRVRITDSSLKQLIQIAMAPNRETLQHLKSGREDLLSTCYKNMVEEAVDYAFSSTTQQGQTTKGTVFGAYNAITGYYQNVRNYKDGESKFKSVMYGSGLQKSQVAFNLCKEFAVLGNEALRLNFN